MKVLVLAMAIVLVFVVRPREIGDTFYRWDVGDSKDVRGN